MQACATLSIAWVWRLAMRPPASGQIVLLETDTAPPTIGRGRTSASAEERLRHSFAHEYARSPNRSRVPLGRRSLVEVGHSHSTISRGVGIVTPGQQTRHQELSAFGHSPLAVGSGELHRPSCSDNSGPGSRRQAMAWFRIRPFWVTQGARKSPACEGRISTGNVPCGRRPASPGHARWG